MELRENKYYLEIMDFYKICLMAFFLDVVNEYFFIVFYWGGNVCICVYILESWIMISECIFGIIYMERRV